MANFTRHVNPYNSIYILALGASGTELGMLTSIGLALTSLSAFLSGWLSDRVDQKRVFLAGAALGILAPVIYMVSGDWRMLVPAFVLAGASEGIMQPAWDALYANNVDDKQRGTTYGFLNIFVMFPVLFAGIIGGTIAKRSGGLTATGIRPLYMVQVALFASVWVIVFRYLSAGKPLQPRGSLNLRTMLDDYRTVLKKPGVSMWTAMKGIGSLSIGLSDPFWMVYAAEVHGASAVIIGYMVTLRVLTQVLLSMFSGKLTDRVGRKSLIIGGRFILYLGAVVFMLLGGTPVMLLASWVIMGVADATGVAWSAEEAELVLPHQRARMRALSITAYFLLAAPTSILGGWLWDSVGKITPFIVMILVDGLIRMPLIYLYVPEGKHIKLKVEAE